MLGLLTALPVLYVCNVDEGLGRGRQRSVAPGRGARQTEGAACRHLGQDRGGDRALPPEERAEFLADLGLTEPGLDRLIRAGYERCSASSPISPPGRRRRAPGP
jgi:ribosome-binding ATPase